MRNVVGIEDGEVVDPSGHPLPPCIVMERGESLDLWSDRNAPDRAQAFTVRPSGPRLLFITSQHVLLVNTGTCRLLTLRYTNAMKRVLYQHLVALQVIYHIAQRMAEFHAAGFVHRDLKPGNVMWLPRANRWTVIDFGCAARRKCAPRAL